MTRDSALAWIRAHETDSNEAAAQALLALLDEQLSAIREARRELADALDLCARETLRRAEVISERDELREFVREAIAVVQDLRTMREPDDDGAVGWLEKARAAIGSTESGGGG